MNPFSASADQSWESLARGAAAGATPAEESLDMLQLLCFSLDRDAYAIPVDCVKEIVRLRAISPIPRVPTDVRGVISLRGVIVQVVDLRRRLGLKVSEPVRSSRIIVVKTGSGRMSGLLVDAVTEVLRIRRDSLLPTPGGDVEAVDFLCSRGEVFLSVLDLERALEFGDGC